MTRLKIFVIILFGLLALIACGPVQQKRGGVAIDGNKSYEASLFRQNCAICHGQEANGKEMEGKLIPSLRYGEAEKLTEEQIYMQISNGKLPMPSFKNQLSEKEIWQMARFIKHDLQGQDSSVKN
jgi:mono/diheme cytochrome c family protein